jgi:hypothetical protein
MILRIKEIQVYISRIVRSAGVGGLVLRIGARHESLARDVLRFHDDNQLQIHACEEACELTSRHLIPGLFAHDLEMALRSTISCREPADMSHGTFYSCPLYDGTGGFSWNRGHSEIKESDRSGH